MEMFFEQPALNLIWLIMRPVQQNVSNQSEMHFSMSGIIILLFFFVVAIIRCIIMTVARKNIAKSKAC